MDPQGMCEQGLQQLVRVSACVCSCLSGRRLNLLLNFGKDQEPPDSYYAISKHTRWFR